jgi:hypothetical protein
VESTCRAAGRRGLAAGQGSVGGCQLGLRRLAAQHSELVAQDEDLQLLGGSPWAIQGEELDGVVQRQGGESWQHLGRPRRPGSGAGHRTDLYRPNPQASDQSEFLHPTRCHRDHRIEQQPHVLALEETCSSSSRPVARLLPRDERPWIHRSVPRSLGPGRAAPPTCAPALPLSDGRRRGRLAIPLSLSQTAGASWGQRLGGAG